MKTLLAATLVLRGATLVDGTGSPPRANSVVVVRDGRIVSTGTAAPGDAPPASGAEVLDVSGKWIVPGLIDAHVHAESDADLQAMLRWGVTSVRLMAEDTAASAALAKASRTRQDIPEVLPAAPIFTAPGGWWAQGQPPDAGLDRFPATAAAAREAVGRAKALGSAEIKIMLDDMAWCRSPLPPFSKLDPDVSSALIGEARRAGLRVIVHAPGLPDARRAILEGATALAHGVLDPFDAATMTTMKSRPVFYVPTMDIFEFLADTRAFVDAVLSDPRVGGSGGLPAATVARYRSTGYADGYRRRYPNFDNVRRHLPALRANLLALHRAGVPIALGTDMWAFPGVGVSIEMDLYVKAGLSASEALQAATRTAARSLGVDSDRGTLEPGRRADFLVLTADPLADVRNVRSIAAVYKGGARVGGPSTR
ncbi:MAG: amidohydrolase family protein [Acidobacteriota bacterium]